MTLIALAVCLDESFEVIIINLSKFSDPKVGLVANTRLSLKPKGPFSG
jgi:hypothetical protein